MLSDPHRTVVRRLGRDLADEDLAWALTGSASFALQGVPVDPDDVDLQTTARGASAVESLFSDAVVDPVSLRESDRLRSQFGALSLFGVRVELMGDLQKRRPDGSWESPVDVTDHRRFETVDGVRVPVLSLEYEARAYERLGREERAALLRRYATADGE